MKSLIVSCLAAMTLAKEIKYAPAATVCVANNGGYMLEWWYRDTMQGTTGRHSRGFSRGNNECMDINTAGSGYYNTFEIWSHATAGHTVDADYQIIWDPNGGTAGFECFGSTMSIHCELQGISMPIPDEAEGTS